MLQASPVILYVTEEVNRQGHNIYLPDGWLRVSWMLNAWCYAWPARFKDPTIQQIEDVGKKVEPIQNITGFRVCDVSVGDHRPPPWQDVRRLLEALWPAMPDMSPLEFYRRFELIHPFRDGNGRTGKILLNWINGTLDVPVFPPNDIFGPTISNP